ncbi:hrp65 protein-like [Aphidius gifuensis]|uniref:hrp65 protein-like n=1 Tax=Aphidius gifuensis TaxID=684658 RepID=UPI001CDD805E|nr:hrp65 protein-like [Aphidius gifuensis]
MYSTSSPNYADKTKDHNWIRIDNIGKNTNFVDIYALLRPIGDISNHYKDIVNNCIFVRMENFDKSKKFNGTILVDTTIKITAVPHITTIKVRNVPQNITDNDLKKAFSYFGYVEKAYVHLDYDGVPRGKGTVVFKDLESVAVSVAACTEYDFFLHESCIVPLKVTRVKKNETEVQINDDINNDFVINPFFARRNGARDFDGLDDVDENNKEALEQLKKQSQIKVKEEVESLVKKTWRSLHPPAV